MKVEFAPGRHWRIFPLDGVADLRACSSWFAEPQGQGAELRSRRSELVWCQPAQLRAAHSGRRCCSQAEARRPALKPTAGLEGITAPGGHRPELTRFSPARPRLAPTDCVLCPGLSFKSQDGTFRVSVHTVIEGTAVGTVQKRRGCVGKGFCVLMRA